MLWQPADECRPGSHCKLTCYLVLMGLCGIESGAQQRPVGLRSGRLTRPPKWEFGQKEVGWLESEITCQISG